MTAWFSTIRHTVGTHWYSFCSGFPSFNIALSIMVPRKQAEWKVFHIQNYTFTGLGCYLAVVIVKIDWVQVLCYLAIGATEKKHSLEPHEKLKSSMTLLLLTRAYDKHRPCLTSGWPIQSAVRTTDCRVCIDLAKTLVPNVAKVRMMIT